ncbi:MAG: helix-turn-helix domain-containing protein [Solirubrobacteraceae bacterium]
MAPLAPSDRPLAHTLAALMTERQLSYRALSERTRRVDPVGDRLTHGHLANLIAGRARPSPRALELIAHALDLEPAYFAEYRLAELRDQLDERRVGFDAALRRYRTLTHAA